MSYCTLRRPNTDVDVSSRLIDYAYAYASVKRRSVDSGPMSFIRSGIQWTDRDCRGEEHTTRSWYHSRNERTSLVMVSSVNADAFD